MILIHLGKKYSDQININIYKLQLNPIIITILFYATEWKRKQKIFINKNNYDFHREC